MRIGELAAATGVSARSLRYYEEQSLLTPSRSPSGQRLYDVQHVAVVGIIRDLVAAGFCSSVISTLIPALVDAETAQSELDDAFAAARVRLESERDAIDRELDALGRLQRTLPLAPHTHVKADAGRHDHIPASEAAPSDHRDRRLRHRPPLLP